MMGESQIKIANLEATVEALLKRVEWLENDVARLKTAPIEFMELAETIKIGGTD